MRGNTDSEEEEHAMQRTYIVVVILTIAALIVPLCPADEALVGYWGFEEGKGEDVADLSGSKNDGVIKGGAEWDQGKIGGGLAFAKDAEAYVEIANSDTLGIADEITMSAWIKPSDIYVGDVWQERNCIVAKVRAYYLDISSNGMLASYLYGVQPEEWLEGETDLTKFVDTWFHVATVYDGKEHKLYVNGNLDASVAKTGAITVNTDNLTIGWVDNNRYFDGLIDEVRIWSRGLTEDEFAGLLSVKPRGKLATCWSAIRLMH
jgi:hypothetical protein